MAKGRARFRGRVEARDAATAFVREAGRIQRDLHKAVRDTADDAELIFASHAPRRSGELARGMRARVAGSLALVEAHAESDDGYDYVGVTRFGHRARVIRPKRRPVVKHLYPTKAKAFPLPFGFRAWIRDFRALSTPFGFRRRVRGYRPRSDWATRASVRVQLHQAARRNLAQVGRGVTVRLSS